MSTQTLWRCAAKVNFFITYLIFTFFSCDVVLKHCFKLLSSVYNYLRGKSNDELNTTVKLFFSSSVLSNYVKIRLRRLHHADIMPQRHLVGRMPQC